MLLDNGRRERQKRDEPEWSSRNDIRGEFARDRDRILFSSLFRRLSGITQVIQPDGRYATHNRLTHSLQVAQIARSIGEHIGNKYGNRTLNQYGGLDTDVLEAASLAHDIGHPPFGHVSERILQDYLGLPDSFEGNAQSFRALTYLSSRYDDVKGLHLTRATLSAVCKYPWLRADEDSGDQFKRDKWNVYETEREVFYWSREHLPSYLASRKTLEAEIMDWSDDIAYAVHDMEDFYRARLIPLERLVESGGKLSTEGEIYVRLFYEGKAGAPFRDQFSFEQVVDKGSELFDSFGLGHYTGDRSDRVAIRRLTSGLIGKYIAYTELYTDLQEGLEKGPLRIDPSISLEVALLKHLTVHFVIHSPALAAQRLGQTAIMRNIVRSLKLLLRDSNRSNHSAFERNELLRQSILTPFFSEVYADLERNHPQSTRRVIADYICNLTESQAVHLGKLITGSEVSNALRSPTE